MTAARSLDRYANRVSPAARIGRRIRHGLRETAGRLLPTERVATCGRKPQRAHVDLVVSDGAAHFVGVETCGSVWNCPVCSPKVGERRKAEVHKALTVHVAGGGVVYLMALTVPHHVFQRAKGLRDVVAAAWRYVQGGKAWKLAKARAGLVGMIRASEVTRGGNGWHPHLHVVLLFDAGTTAAAAWALADWIFARWAKFVEARGFGECSPRAFDFQKCEKPEAAGDYVTKWGLVDELVAGTKKQGRAGGESPWQLLADAQAGDARAGALFQEYARAFKGARQLTWTHGLKALLQVDEKTDEEIAAETPAFSVRIGIFSKQTFALIARRGLTSDVLTAAEIAGWAGVRLLLEKYGVSLDGEAYRVGTFGLRSPKVHGEISDVDSGGSSFNSGVPVGICFPGNDGPVFPAHRGAGN